MRILLLLLLLFPLSSSSPSNQYKTDDQKIINSIRPSITVSSEDTTDGQSIENTTRSAKKTRSISSGIDSSNEEVKIHSSKTNASPTRFLKNRLLDNLNKYFNDESGALEILSAESNDPNPEGTWNNAQPQPQWNNNQWIHQPFQQPTPNPWLSWTTPVPFIPHAHLPSPNGNIHPTLISTPHLPMLHTQPHVPDNLPIPFDRSTSEWKSSGHNRQLKEDNRALSRQVNDLPSKISTNQRITPKKRKRGESLNKDTMQTIRNWRHKLYKAFKQNEESQPIKITRVLNNNTSDKNIQVLKSRDQSNSYIDQQQQTYGEDPSGTITPMFGMERTRYRFSNQPQSVVPPYIPPPQIPSNTIYLPSSHSFSPPPQPPNTYYTVPTTPSPNQFTIFPTLNNMITFPTPSPVNFYPYTGAQVTSKPPTLPPLLSPPSNNDDYTPDFDEKSIVAMRGVTCTNGDDCDQSPQRLQEVSKPINEDKCNSERLREIIERNIVANDAEASKRAVQESAEEITGRYFDAICGTGFFSYIAHTDEFCQASSLGVNCYLFSPVCGNTQTNNPFEPFKKNLKRSVSSVVNKN